MIRNTYCLPQFFFDITNSFVHLVALFRQSVGIHFQLIKLVHPEQAASMFTICARFFAIAWTQARVQQRQVGFMQNLVGMVTGQ